MFVYHRLELDDVINLIKRTKPRVDVKETKQKDTIMSTEMELMMGIRKKSTTGGTKNSTIQKSTSNKSMILGDSDRWMNTTDSVAASRRKNMKGTENDYSPSFKKALQGSKSGIFNRLDRSGSRSPSKSILKTKDAETAGAGSNKKQSYRPLETTPARSVKRSKYFGNIFGNPSALGLFPVASPGQQQPPGKADNLSPAGKQNRNAESDDEVDYKSLKKKKARFEGDSTRGAAIWDTEWVEGSPERKSDKNDQSYNTGNMKSPFLNGGLGREQFFEILGKTSEIAKRNASLKASFVQLTAVMPLNAIGFQNMRVIYKGGPGKPRGGAQTFHSACDGNGPYLGFVVHQTGSFGFFIEPDFVDEFEVFARSSLSFMFILQCPKLGTKFMSMKVRKGFEDYALCNTEEGFCLGKPSSKKRDLMLNFNDLSKSSSHLGFAYDCGDLGKHDLTGKFTDWGITDIEIIQVITKSNIGSLKNQYEFK